MFLLLLFELVPSEPNDINKTRLIQVSRGNSSFPQIRVRNRKLFFLFLNQLLVNYCLRHQVLLSVLLRFLTVCQGIRDRGSTARYGLTRTVVRLLPACHVLLEPLTSSYVPTKFGYVYQFPPRFSTVKHGRCV